MYPPGTSGLPSSFRGSRYISFDTIVLGAIMLKWMFASSKGQRMMRLQNRGAAQSAQEGMTGKNNRERGLSSILDQQVRWRARRIVGWELRWGGSSSGNDRRAQKAHARPFSWGNTSWGRYKHHYPGRYFHHWYPQRQDNIAEHLPRHLRSRLADFTWLKYMWSKVSSELVRRSHRLLVIHYCDQRKCFTSRADPALHLFWSSESGEIPGSLPHDKEAGPQREKRADLLYLGYWRHKATCLSYLGTITFFPSLTPSIWESI